MMDSELKSFWSRFFDFNWKFGLFLILIVCIPRFILVLNANYSGSYGSSIALIMTISAIAPFLFLTKYGRKEIGITKPQNFNWLFIGLACGLLASFALHFIGQLLYDNSYQNWYQYIGKLYNIPATITQTDKKVMFAISINWQKVLLDISEYSTKIVQTSTSCENDVTFFEIVNSNNLFHNSAPFHAPNCVFVSDSK